MLKKYRNILFWVCASFLLVGGILIAGEISTDLDPTPTFHTLEDVYNKLTDEPYTDENHDLLPTTSTDNETMYSLEDIFDITPVYRELNNSTTTLQAGIYSTTTLSDIEPNLLPENIVSGAEIFGVTGTY